MDRFSARPLELLAEVSPLMTLWTTIIVSYDSANPTMMAIGIYTTPSQMPMIATAVERPMILEVLAVRL